MSSPLAVSDHASNANEQIDHAARTIGTSPARRSVFLAVYKGKRRIKTVGEIAESTGLTRKQVLTAGKQLVNRSIVGQTQKDGDTAYEKFSNYYSHKAKILSLAGNKVKLEKFPTKRNSRVSNLTILQRFAKQADFRLITIDDVDSFKRVQSHKPNGNISPLISENRFKHGVRRILGEVGEFKDWGGEKNDLYTTRVEIGGKRFAAAFAFKGPGKKGTLVPGKMGKNGDQIQRLFESSADVFFVQYWRDIAESVVDQMKPLALAKSIMTGKKVYFGIIDGVDSDRLLRAYSTHFNKG
jgi:hypothetical protein